MTTLAYRDGVLAADSGVFFAGNVLGAVDKVFKNEKGWLGGGCGSLAQLQRFKEWFLAGADFEQLPDIGEESEMMMVSPEGVVSYLDGNGRLFSYVAAFHANGAGMEVALGAMHAGASAIEAVQAAIVYNCTTHGPVNSVSLDHV